MSSVREVLEAAGVNCAGVAAEFDFFDEVVRRLYTHPESLGWTSGMPPLVRPSLVDAEDRAAFYALVRRDP